jgi:hypothetical protein
MRIAQAQPQLSVHEEALTRTPLGAAGAVLLAADVARLDLDAPRADETGEPEGSVLLAYIMTQETIFGADQHRIGRRGRRIEYTAEECARVAALGEAVLANIRTHGCDLTRHTAQRHAPHQREQITILQLCVSSINSVHSPYDAWMLRLFGLLLAQPSCTRRVLADCRPKGRSILHCVIREVSDSAPEVCLSLVLALRARGVDPLAEDARGGVGVHRIIKSRDVDFLLQCCSPTRT